MNRVSKKIVRFFTLLLVCTFVTGSIPVSASTEPEVLNLLLNSGFEEGTGLDGWIVYTTHTGEVAIDQQVKFEGERSLRYTIGGTFGARSMIGQTFMPITPGGVYELSAYYQTLRMTTEGLALQLYWYDGNKQYIAPFINHSVPNGATDWTLTTLLEQAPANARYASVYINAMRGAGGQVWFDNVSLKEIPSADIDVKYVTYDKGDNGSQDVVVNMDLKGYDFLGIENNGVALVPGQDYLMFDQTVTITGSYMSLLAPGETLLSFKFSQGADAVLSISVIDTSVATVNLLANPGFEGSTAGWLVIGHTGEVAIDTDKKYAGESSMRFSIGGAFGARSQIGQTFFPINALSTYELGTFYCMEGMTTEDIGLEIYWYDAGKKYIAPYIHKRLANDATDWIHYSYFEQAPENAVYASIYINALSGKGGKVWFDNIYFSEVVLGSVEVVPDTTILFPGQSTRLSVEGVMTNGEIADLTDTVITYESENETVATVTDGGVVTGTGAGTTEITVSVQKNDVIRQASGTITVTQEALSGLLVFADRQIMTTGETMQLSAAGVTSSGQQIQLSNDNITYASSDSFVASVTAEGLVTATSPGAVTITLSVPWSDVKGSLEVKVIPPYLTTITASATKTEIVTGNTSQTILTGLLSNGETFAAWADAIIEFTSSDPSVAVIANKGEITGIGAGTVVITVKVTSLDTDPVLGSFQMTVVDPESIQGVKTRSTYYTNEKVAAARENVMMYEWAAKEKDNAVSRADTYVALGDQYLWNLVTPPTLPRAIYHLTRNKAGEIGCPVCGTAQNKFGNNPWLIDPVNKPWKLTCPECSTVFPTNDFESFYKSGLDRHGLFDPDLADRSLLVNTLYPEKGPNWGVDDGMGWKNGDDINVFIAYYNHWGIWYSRGIVNQALSALTDAYLYTADTKYAHAGIILLDRIADVYPDMDITDFRYEDGFDNGIPSMHTYQGKILHDIWETGLVKTFILAYDAFYPALAKDDSANVVPFLSGQSDRYDLGVNKYSAGGIRKNIEDGILREVYPAFKNSQIRGNFGMHQSTLALAAVVLDEEGTSQEMLDFMFQSGDLKYVSGSEYPNGRHYYLTGGDVLSALTEDVDRDGFGNEAAPGYNNIWITQMKLVADALDGYDRYPESDLYNNVKFRNMFKARYQLIMLGKYIPSIGDSGAGGQPGLGMTPDLFVEAFKRFGEPVFAQVAYLLNDNSAYNLKSSIFTRNPEDVAQEIQDVIDTYGTLNLESLDLTGYGLATLRDGVDYTKRTGFDNSFMEIPIVDSSGKEIKTISFPALFYRSEGAGDYVTFEFDVKETDMYNVGMITVLSPAYGKYVVEVDGVQIGEEYDAYGPVVEESPVTYLGELSLEAGKHTVTFKCVGKNDSSSNFLIGLRNLVLTVVTDEGQPLYTGNLQRDAWIYYGRNTGHGHKDTLNLGIHAYGLNLAPDLGYPAYTGDYPERVEWTNNTISHNTVLVDKYQQKNSWVGTPKHFDATERVKLMDIEAPKVYSQTQMYRRTTAMIRVDEENSYMVDFFRVKGGNEHHFSFHSDDALVSTENLNLVDQPTGTYAGVDIPYGVRPPNEGSGPTSGFHYLFNVQRDPDPSDNFSVDWQQVKNPDVHLRLTMLGDVDDIALADGIPPQNRAGNPPSYRYLIARREGTNLSSTFTSVLEPYKDNRYITEIQQVPVTLNGEPVTEDIQAVKVVLETGRVDYIVCSIDQESTYLIDGKFQFKGFFGVYSEVNGTAEYSYINDGETIGSMTGKNANVQGNMVDFTRGFNLENEITISIAQQDVNVDVNNLVGRYIYVQNDGVRNASYKIEGIKSQNGNLVTLDIGSATLIRQYVDPLDFTKGFVYDVSQGAQVVIPLSYEGHLTLGYISEVLAKLVTEMEVTGPMIPQLENRIKQAKHHYDKGSVDQAVKHLEDLLKSLNNEALKTHVSDLAQDMLNRSVNDIINQWKTLLS